MLTPLLRLFKVYDAYERFLKSQIDGGVLPKHIGIILDGNRRWASTRSYPRRLGHIMGAEKAEQLLDWCHELGIKTLTLYVLSTENLQRPAKELAELMELFEERLKRLLKDERIHRYRIRVKALGKVELLPESIRRLLLKAEGVTEKYDDRFLNIAIAYGGRTEIVDGVRKIAEKVKAGLLQPCDVDQRTVGDHLYTAGLPNPEPDLIIRTSGEERLSGFLLWQSAYSELVFFDAYWPEFRKIDLMRAIRIYQKRAKRFGI